MSEAALLWSGAAVLIAAIVLPAALSFARRNRHDRRRLQEAARLGIVRPVAQHPSVDRERCIGCASCVSACPEGDVLGIVGGVAVVINGLRCVGHATCQEACPVGAIEVGLGDLGRRPDVPALDGFGETSVPGLFVAGELGGLSLIRNAIEQGNGRWTGSRGGCSDHPTSGPTITST